MSELQKHRDALVLKAERRKAHRLKMLAKKTAAQKERIQRDFMSDKVRAYEADLPRRKK